MSCSGMSSTVSRSASSFSWVPFLVSWREQKGACLIVTLYDNILGFLDYLCASLLTFSLRASSFSSLSRLRSFSRRRSCCSTANSASVYVRSALWRCIIPRVHPPRLGTLVKPWHRGKKNTVTWSKVTLPRRGLLAFLRMDVAVDGESIDLEYILWT